VEIQKFRVRFRLEDNNVLVVGYDVATPPPMHVQERRMCQAINQDLLSFDPSVIGVRCIEIFFSKILLFSRYLQTWPPIRTTLLVTTIIRKLVFY
jgi:hypothetical protein